MHHYMFKLFAQLSIIYLLHFLSKSLSLIGHYLVWGGHGRRCRCCCYWCQGHAGFQSCEQAHVQRCNNLETALKFWSFVSIKKYRGHNFSLILRLSAWPQCWRRRRPRSSGRSRPEGAQRQQSYAAWWLYSSYPENIWLSQNKPAFRLPFWRMHRV